jgi:thioredoxin 1
MPTFKIFHKGTCVETIKGANPSALTEAVTKAVQLAGGANVGDLFKSRGHTLGGGADGNGGAVAGGPSFDFSTLFTALIGLVGLYLISLFSAGSSSAK